MEEIALLIGGRLLAAAWEVLVAVMVPIGAAGLAALVVVRQIRQLDRHRTEDRQSDAVLALTDLLSREAALALNPTIEGDNVLAKFRTNESLVRAYALLPPSDYPVARWTARQRDRIRDEADLAMEAGEYGRDTVGTHRANAARIAGEAMEQLLDWQRGETQIKWFSERIGS